MTITLPVKHITQDDGTIINSLPDNEPEDFVERRTDGVNYTYYMAGDEIPAINYKDQPVTPTPLQEAIQKLSVLDPSDIAKLLQAIG